MQSIRPSTSARRLGALVGPALIGAIILSSCGGSESAATQSTIDLSAASTAFVVRPPATTVPPTDSLAAGDPEAIVEGTQEYEVQSGDAPFVLVTRFGVTLEDLLGVNEWTNANQFPFPGTVILIPPGGKSVAAYLAGATASPAPAAEDTSDDTAADTAGDTPTETIPDAGDNCAPGTYTILDTDTTRGGVADKFDVTVQALDAANANTPGYSAFYPGLEIVIPAKADC
jgi:LysM repeat protein